MKILKVIGIILRGIVALLFLITAIWMMVYVLWFSLAFILEFMSHLWLGILIIVLTCSVDVLIGMFLFWVWAWIIPINTEKVIVFFLQD